MRGVVSLHKEEVGRELAALGTRRGVREEDSRIRKDHGPENMTTLRQIALNRLKPDMSITVGIKSKRKNAGWNERYLLKVLNG